MASNKELKRIILPLINAIQPGRKTLINIMGFGRDNARVEALGKLMNLSYADENGVYMGSKDLGLLPALIAVVSSDSGEARVKALGTLWNLSLRHENIDYLVCCHGMSVVLAALQLSPKGSDSFKTSLTVLMVSGRILSAARDLFVAGGVEIISPLLDGGGVDGIKAAIILSFLLGKEESRGTQLSLLESKPQLTDLLESIFNNTVNGLGGDGYEFGNFDLVVIVAAIASMAVSDNNKAILSQRPTILLCLFQVLSLFLDDSPPIPYRGTGNSYGVGGGGQDIESAESAIESLQLLSFVYENDSDLRQHYKEIGVDVLFSMKRIMTHPKLSNNAKQGAQYLRNRLEEKTVPLPTVETAIPSVVEHKKHLMLSYAWGCKKELVISLQEKLTSFGVEVWRDETGSSLLSKMQGATDDIMAKAIELSHTVVVCVSPHYKASANCRQEGKYTNAMYKKGMLNIIYVMMDGDYYKSVDGWLGIMLGDSLWYPLWDAQNVIQTASDIAANVTACHRGDTPHLVVPQASSPAKDDSLRPPVGSPVTLVQQSSPAIDPHYDEAWTILTDPSKASDPEGLMTLFSKLGLSKASELVDCDEEIWNDLASYLKPIPKRALLRILARKNPEK
mmetsp:Transcript_12713/g.17346  ORF Transcript_12713/g.17346 Transcript_12713/m.17346 type:complete len:620 (+) Transcript_12713:226-2085(+)